MSRKYCKELGCFYGDPEPKYGGILVNLNEMPHRTTFHVANGAWEGFVAYKNGEKGLFIYETETFRKLGSSSHQNLWFDRLSVPDEFYDSLEFDGDNTKNDWFIFEKGTSIFEIRDFFQNSDLIMRSPSGKAIDIVSKIHYKNNAKDAEQDSDYER